MKHAYLILAHNDAALLEILVNCLDDSRNDLFIHWDAKSGAIPTLKTAHSRLFILDERIAVNWAGFSVVEAEYLLYKKAFKNGPYAYYHLLSGTDLPIKSQDYIHSACDAMAGTEFIAFADTTQEELDYRAQHYFLFPERFKGANVLIRALRKAFISIQDLVGYHRIDIAVKKGSQWCSVTQDFVEYLLSKERDIKNWFHHTFCPDELFVQTLCANSPFIERIKKASSEFEGNLRFIKWENGRLMPITLEDIPTLRSSDRWFARKFSSGDQVLVNTILNMVSSHDFSNHSCL